MKHIPLTQGYQAKVDDWNYEHLSKYKWRVHKAYGILYACRSSKRQLGKQKMIFMHSQVMGRSWIDHINGDGLDNRECNLRPATNSQNQANTGPQKTNTSGYKGVDWHKKQQRWRARINVNGTRLFLGEFLDIKDAVEAYNKAAKRYFGEYAKVKAVK